MADAIRPFFSNDFVRDGILLMFCNAAVLGSTAILLSSAWAFSEVKGWKHGLETRVADAPVLRDVRTLYSRCGLTRVSSRSAAPTYNCLGSGTSRHHFAVRDNFPADSAERSSVAWRSLGEPAVEQPD
jgi:hypothetical protein